ncbi:RraA family protein [Opitutia bacterium ISCC 51]|nr:RraA family protein [Opitutae bacterium ISCC 51]QXD27327.1 RraA family protein [Opitutae bacterium ISCC 52]
MSLWENDEELFQLARRELFTAVVGDVLDKMGLLKQFLPPSIKPLDHSMVVIGRAMTVLEQDLDQQEDESGQNDFGLMFDALDGLQANEVYICSGASPSYALWGGLMSTRALKLGAVGAVMNGYSRDTPEIRELEFPTFSMGTYAQDQGPRGRVVDYRSPIDFSGIPVASGDIVYGDLDGVLIIPANAVEEAFASALEKARGEKLVRKALEDGMPAKEAFEEFGIM